MCLHQLLLTMKVQWVAEYADIFFHVFIEPLSRLSLLEILPHDFRLYKHRTDDEQLAQRYINMADNQ
jgi:hypothetical protein